MNISTSYTKGLTQDLKILYHIYVDKKYLFLNDKFFYLCNNTYGRLLMSKSNHYVNITTEESREDDSSVRSKSDVRLNLLDGKFKRLLDLQFQYTSNTNSNLNVKHEIRDDVWNLFRVLVESDNFDNDTKTLITRTLRKEIERRVRFVK